MPRPLTPALVALLLATSGTNLVACSNVPSSIVTTKGIGQIALTPVVAGRARGVLDIVSPYTQSDVDHLVLKLYSVTDGQETAVPGPDDAPVSANIPSSMFSEPIVFSGLAANTTYRIRGFAYKAAEETFANLISDESSSFVDVTVGNDYAPQMAQIPIQLIDFPFEAEATSSIVVTSGGLTGVGAESIKIAGFLPLQGLVTTFAGTGTAGSQDGETSLATFNLPKGVAAAPDGTIYVSDSGNRSIRKITPKGTVSTLMNAFCCFTPHGLALAPNGDIVAADWAQNRVTRITPQGVMTNVATGITAPSDVAVDSEGVIYVADYYYQIKKIATDGQVSVVAGDGTKSTTSPPIDGQGTAAKFDSISAIEVGPDGKLYVAQLNGSYIRVIDPTDGTVVSKSLYGVSNVAGLAFDSNGTLYVSRSTAALNKVEVDWNASNWSTTLLAGTPHQYGYADGLGSDARFQGNNHLAFDGYDRLYVSESSNHRIRTIR